MRSKSFLSGRSASRDSLLLQRFNVHEPNPHLPGNEAQVSVGLFVFLVTAMPFSLFSAVKGAGRISVLLIMAEDLA